MRSRRQPGFALLLTLVLVLLAGAALAGVARRSAVGALESQQAVEELQRRWAATSCQSTLLKRAPKVLEQAERGEGNREETGAAAYANDPVAERRVSCELAGHEYQLVFTDEQAKLNLNGVLASSDRSRAERVVRRLMEDAGAAAVKQVDVQPLRLGKDQLQKDLGMELLGGYGQVFPGATAEALAGSEGSRGLTQRITLWGPNSVNVRRAPAEVIAEACEKALDKRVVKDLLAVRDKDPYLPLKSMVQALEKLDDREKSALYNLLTDESACHGLWVIAKDGRRSWYALSIGVGADGELNRIHEFAW